MVEALARVRPDQDQIGLELLRLGEQATRGSTETHHREGLDWLELELSRAFLQQASQVVFRERDEGIGRGGRCRQTGGRGPGQSQEQN